MLSTTLWGHDYLPELYTSPQPAKPNDVGGCYFADAEKLNELQDQLYCWAGTTANLLTWGGWAANSPLAFADEDETLEYFIDYWKNEGGQDRDAFSWFVNGTGDSGDIIVPAEGGNLFPTLDAGEYQFTVTADEAGATSQSCCSRVSTPVTGSGCRSIRMREWPMQSPAGATKS